MVSLCLSVTIGSEAVKNLLQNILVISLLFFSFSSVRIPSGMDQLENEADQSIDTEK